MGTLWHVELWGGGIFFFGVWENFFIFLFVVIYESKRNPSFSTVSLSVVNCDQKLTTLYYFFFFKRTPFLVLFGISVLGDVDNLVSYVAGVETVWKNVIDVVVLLLCCCYFYPLCCRCCCNTWCCSRWHCRRWYCRCRCCCCHCWYYLKANGRVCF